MKLTGKDNLMLCLFLVIKMLLIGVKMSFFAQAIILLLFIGRNLDLKMRKKHF